MRNFRAVLPNAAALALGLDIGSATPSRDALADSYKGNFI